MHAGFMANDVATLVGRCLPGQISARSREVMQCWPREPPPATPGSAGVRTLRGPLIVTNDRGYFVEASPSNLTRLRGTPLFISPSVFVTGCDTDKARKAGTHRSNSEGRFSKGVDERGKLDRNCAICADILCRWVTNWLMRMIFAVICWTSYRKLCPLWRKKNIVW